MDADEAIRIAELWQAGKMIGADEDEVREALLNECLRLRESIKIAFALGFIISREGFNGECGYEVCAPSRLESDHGDETIEEFIADIEKNPIYRTLRDWAIEYINKPNAVDQEIIG